MTPEIPPAQVERLKPILDEVLNNLRRRTEKLPPQCDMALTYHPQVETCR